MSVLHAIRALFATIYDAVMHMTGDDGFALASHVALSSLLALFPFLIFVAALTGFLGMSDLADRIAMLLFDAWPEQVARPIAREIEVVLTQPRGDILTFGIVAALWFASNGVEALRVALNRAYGVAETRGYLFLRLQALLLVLFGTFVLISFALLIIVAPLVWQAAIAHAPLLEPFTARLNLSRYVIASLLTFGGLFAAHALLPAGRRRILDMLPGVAATLVLWLVSGAAFGAWLAGFANYVSTYAGLAGVMTALVFLYLISICFVFGGELNAAILRRRARRAARPA
ncbi:YihY/virulence factor BrkB family protein [Stappia sp.]|jgi:membrane protein|uniref:YihY/virulence factor BrkB family protein n=1 Tax=Stappia sp. TaxID=1870903 RepID=UPI003D0CF8D7